ncbi:MAG: AMP-binding protein, partial [Gammaproteobacteria bacterium]|nr:AMP-binding protein [Gammaproteobacteria bacterium]
MEDFVPFDRTDIEASIPALFDRQVRVGPARIAVSDGHNRYTYAELDRWSNRIAQGLLRLRGDGEEPVTLLFRQSAAAVAATLGTLKAGKIYVPLDPNESESELRQVVSDCRPSLIVSDAPHGALANSVIGRSGEVLDITNLTATDADEDPGLDIGPERLCYIFYTSGTTGPRKGVFDNHRNVLHNVMRYTNSLQIGPA